MKLRRVLVGGKIFRKVARPRPVAFGAGALGMFAILGIACGSADPATSSTGPGTPADESGSPTSDADVAETTTSPEAAPPTSPAGTLDPSFGDEGAAMLAISPDPATTSACGVAIQKDGKPVVATVHFTTKGTTLDLVRFRANGTVDSAFGTDGVASTALGGADPHVRTCNVVVTTEGDVVVFAASAPQPSLVRYDGAGTRLSSIAFGATFAVPTLVPSSMAIQADGKVLLAGNVPNPNGIGTQMAVVRVDEAGVVDETFGTHGLTTFATGATAAALALAVQSDGSVLAVGTTKDDLAALGTGTSVVRWDGSGKLDSTFGSPGVLLAGTAGPVPNAIVVRSGGALVIGGERGLLAGLTSTGAPDSTWAPAGLASSTNVAALGVDTKGRIVVYDTDASGVGTAHVQRFEPNGALDTTFGKGGIAPVPFERSVAAGMALQDDTIVVVATLPSLAELGIARYFQ